MTNQNIFNNQNLILSNQDLDRIFRNLQSDHHRLFFAIARYSGASFGSIVKLRVVDVFGSDCLPLQQINFVASGGALENSGAKHGRSAQIFPKFREILSAYRPKDCDRLWLFPSKIKAGDHLSWSACDKWLRAAVNKAGLSHKNISGHSLRRSFIASLIDAGIDSNAIAQISGHKSISGLHRYIGRSPKNIRDTLGAIFS